MFPQKIFQSKVGSSGSCTIWSALPTTYPFHMIPFTFQVLRILGPGIANVGASGSCTIWSGVCQSLVAGRCQPYVPLGPTYSIPVGQKKPHTRAQTPSTQQDQQDCTLADCSATASRIRHPREERTHRRAGAHFAFAQSPVG